MTNTATLQCHAAAAACPAVDYKIPADPRARPLTPRPRGLSYGNSLLRERAVGAGDARQQERIATHERSAGLR